MASYFSRGKALIQAIRTNSLQIGSTGAPIKNVQTGTASVNPPSIAATTRGTATFTIEGAAAGDLLILNPPDALEAGLLYVGHSIAAGTVTIYLYNPTGGAVDGSARNWRYQWVDLT